MGIWIFFQVLKWSLKTLLQLHQKHSQSIFVMHSLNAKTFNSPSEISIVSRQSSSSFSLFYTIPQPFPFIKASLKNKIAPFHSLICETLSREERRKKKRKMQIFKMFCVANFFFSFFAKSRSCFVSKLLKNEEKYFVCDFIHNSADWWKSSTRNPTCSLPSARSKNKHIISFLVAKCNKVDFYVPRLNGIRFLVFLSRNELRARRFQPKIQILPVLLIVFLCYAVSCPFNWNFPTGPREFFFTCAFVLLVTQLLDNGRGSTHNFDVLQNKKIKKTSELDLATHPNFNSEDFFPRSSCIILKFFIVWIQNWTKLVILLLLHTFIPLLLLLEVEFYWVIFR